MVFGNCTTCQRKCRDPNRCISNCTEPTVCVCPDRFLLKGEDCVPREECQCYIEGVGVIPDGEIYVSSNCLKRCFCEGNQLTCDNAYRCSAHAVCEERKNVLQCYCNEGYIGDGINCIFPPIDCQDVYDRVSIKSGVYLIKPTTWPGDPFEVYCNMTLGGGWTVFLRRVNGSQNFTLFWFDYENGFGTPVHELWLGNDKLHSILTQGRYQLQVDLVNSLGDPYYATYTSFNIANKTYNYKLSVGGYNGTSGDYLDFFNGQPFTTRDRDNDLHRINCVMYPISNCGGPDCTFSGGWWYNKCGYPLTGPYGTGCFAWFNLPGNFCNLQFTEMKVRPN